MDTTLIIAIAVIVIAVAVIAFIMKGRSHAESVTAAPPPATIEPVTPPPVPEGDGVIDSAAAAAADVAGEFIGVDAHPDGPADELTVLKGLGPKASAQLNALGITRYAHIASWSGEDVAAIDARMGTFKGRIVRDKWVEQAKHLAAGDREGFEAKFGKLGS